MNSAEIFRKITGALDQARIPYMVVGSFATMCMAPDGPLRTLTS